MTKSIFLLLFLVATVAVANAQAKPKVTVKKVTVTQPATTAPDTAAGSNAGWSEAAQKAFVNGCVGSSKMGPEKGTAYCTCMLGKVMKLYPHSADLSTMSQEKMVELAKECFSESRQNDSTWAASERTAFLKECTKNAIKNMGATKTKFYCNCMLGKIEKAFPNPIDSGKMTTEEMNQWAAECLGKQ